MRIFVLAAMLSMGCSGASKAWRGAKKAGTADAYRAFALNNPTDPKRPEALVRIEQLDWDHAITRGSVDAWGNYVAYHPGSARIGEARASLEEARWKAAVDENSRQGYDLYLANHSEGPHGDEARAKLDAIAWEEADREGSVDSYGRYLVRYPNSAHTDEARSKREELIWADAKRQDGPLAYQKYLKKFPRGVHADQAKAAVEGFRFSGVAIRLVVRRVVRPDSIDTWKRSLDSSLGQWLREEGFAVAWLDPMDARGKTVDPFGDLLTTVPQDHATLVIEIEEEKGRPFAPAGHATDVEATVHVVPPARVRPFIEKSVDASTGARVRSANPQGLHLDAQKQLGYAIESARIGLEEWKR